MLTVPPRNTSRPNFPCLRPLLVAAMLLSSNWFGISPLLAQSATPGPITNQATGSFIDELNNTPVPIESNTVTVTVVEVAGITVTAETPTEAPISVTGAGSLQGNGNINIGDIAYFDYIITNKGNDSSQFFIPNAPSSITGGTFNAATNPIQIIAYNPTGTADIPVALNIPTNGLRTGPSTATGTDGLLGRNGIIPVGGSIKIRVPIKVTAAAGDSVTVVMGNTSPTPLSQNQDYTNNNNLDIYTQDNPDTTIVNAAGAIETLGTPANGIREASANQSTTVASLPICVQSAGDGSYATTGTNKNSIWWLNWECYNDSTAITPGGQPFSFTLPDGSLLTTSVRRTGSEAVLTTTAPTFGGAAIGSGQYNGIAGKPIFYSKNPATTASSWQESLTNIVVTDKAGNPRNYSFVSADGESTDSAAYNERLTFTTNGSPWSLVELVPQSGSVAPTTSSSLAGVGSTTATWTAPRTNNNGSVILSTNSPSNVAVGSNPQGTSFGGKQGAFFGLGLPKITLIKNITGRVAPADQFTTQIAYTSPTVSISSATSTGTQTTFSTVPTSALPGNIISLSETMAAGSSSALASYLSSIACTNTKLTSTTVLPSGKGTNFTLIPQIGDDITCTISNAPGNPNLLLVKRITGINGLPQKRNGDSLNLYENSSSAYDDNVLTILNQPTKDDPQRDTNKWPDTINDTSSGFLLGAIDGGTIKPKDSIEYTIYFLSTGDSSAKNVLFCDRVPENVTFIPTAFNSLVAGANGLTGSDRGIAVNLSGTLKSYTNIGNDDFARYFPPGTEPDTVFPKVKCGGTNTNGAVVVNFGDIPTSIPGSYGFVRFQGQVK